MWAERFGTAFPAVESFQEYLYEHAWQPAELFRPGNRQVLDEKHRIDTQGRVAWSPAPTNWSPSCAVGWEASTAWP